MKKIMICMCVLLVFLIGCSTERSGEAFGGVMPKVIRNAKPTAPVTSCISYGKLNLTVGVNCSHIIPDGIFIDFSSGTCKINATSYIREAVLPEADVKINYQPLFDCQGFSGYQVNTASSYFTYRQNDSTHTNCSESKLGNILDADYQKVSYEDCNLVIKNLSVSIVPRNNNQITCVKTCDNLTVKLHSYARDEKYIYIEWEPLQPTEHEAADTKTFYCTDGTSYGNCSTNQPNYCDNGTIRYNCTMCGCPQGQSCSTEGACTNLTTNPTMRCGDSDNGLNFSIRGEATGYLTTELKEYGVLRDHCTDSAGGRTEIATGNYLHELGCTGSVISHTWIVCPYGCENGACRPAQLSEETICNDGQDNDRDGVPDCFDADCGDACPGLFSLGTVCCLDHTERKCHYEESFETGMCESYGKYPVINEAVCLEGCRRFGYEYIS